MGSVEDKPKSGFLTGGTQTLATEMKLLQEMHEHNGVRKALNNELWHACAGPLVSLPQVGSLVYYFPQGHSEQVAASTKRSATSQIPNYPNLASQLLCQVQSFTLHADKETDEIYAQMSLQPVNSERDVFPTPDFGFKPSKHPSEFFCKTLTASDTSTHGGFSVPRRAAEKLFPPLDYTIQPPTQELVVRDLHDHTWTFRHIYRGQPKRHLLTTGWSMFVGSKRLKAGDAVLFIRDDKSQLLVGVRRANRQPTTLPSSVLSADSMHIGVLAAAAHAASAKTPFTIFYNPRACISEFVIPLAKYRKAVYGTQLSAGMRFGMMFETEESSKRRYMGSVIGISDLDPLRWPGSKWRNIQVEWDEPGSSDKQNRVSSWEIETPESLFIFPSLTSGLKRPLYSGFFGAEHGWGVPIRRSFLHGSENANVHIPNSFPNQYSEHLIKTLKPQPINYSGNYTSVMGQDFTAKGDFSHDMHSMLDMHNHNIQTKCLESMFLQNQVLSQVPHDQPHTLHTNSMSKVEQSCKLKSLGKTESPHHSGMVPDDRSRLNSEVLTDQLSALTSMGECNIENLIASPIVSQNHVGQFVHHSQNQALQQFQTRLWSMQPQFEPSTFHSHPIDVPQPDSCYLSGLIPSVDTNDWIPSSQLSTGIMSSNVPSSSLSSEDHPALLPEVNNPALLPLSQEMMDQHPKNSSFLPQANQVGAISQGKVSSLKCMSSSNDLNDLSDESNNHSGAYSTHNVDNGNSAVVDPSVSDAILDEFCSLKDDCFVGNLSSSQDVRSQITCASLAESQTLCLQEIHDNSVGTSSSNVDFDDSCLLQNSSWQQIPPPPIRTYTKVQKAGSVGRSIDVTCFTNYEELCSAIERMFGLNGLLNEKGSGWKLVYVDYENDVLLVGDDPWKEFVGCVRCIRILSPSEVKQMSEEGMQLLNSAAMQGINGTILE